MTVAQPSVVLPSAAGGPAPPAQDVVAAALGEAGSPATPAAGSTQEIFLSYNRVDAEAACRLRDALREAGHEVFMDQVHLVAGERWRQRLHREVTQARAVVVLMGPAGPQGFVLEELRWALEARAKAAETGGTGPLIFPVHRGATPVPEAMPPLARELLEFQLTAWPVGEPTPPGLLQALDAVLPGRPPRPEHCPFKGLAPFEEADAEWFFGRLRESHEVIDALGSEPRPDGRTDLAAPAHRRLVLLSGDSGAGKTSLLCAGVLPLLRGQALWPRTGLAHWRIAGPLRPGPQPLEALADSLAAALAPASDGAGPRRAGASDVGRAGLLEAMAGGGEALVDVVRRALGPDAGLVLVVDAFEELLPTTVDRAERLAFDRVLGEALGSPTGPLYLLAAVRADTLQALDAALPNLARVRGVGGVYAMPRMAETGLRLVVGEAARRAGLDVTEVGEMLVAEARDEPGALGLVQHALWSLWHSAHHRGRVMRLLRSDLEAAGGLGGMLARDADAAVAVVRQRLGSDVGARRLLLRLTWVGDGDRLFRRRLGRAEAEREAGQGDPVRGAQLIDLLCGVDLGQGPLAGESARLPLLVRGNDAEGGGSVELVHEMLLRCREQADGSPVPVWPWLHRQVVEHLGEIKLAQRLQADVSAWGSAGRWQRWRLLASWREQRLYATLPATADAATRQFLGLSRARSATLLLAAALPLGWLAAGSWMVWREGDLFPLHYALVLPLWALGRGAEPDFVRLPGETARFDLGCDPARDTVGTLGCGGGFLPLQRGFSQPIVCDMGRTEVSFEQFDRYVFSERADGRAGIAYPAPFEKVRGALPVTEVSRAQAQAYAAWLTRRSGGRARYRLPTEWEWEHAARGGSEGPYPWGREPPTGRAVHDDGLAPAAPRPVDHGAPNGFGLFNVVGNASEWVADDADAADAAAPRHVWRGGSWNQGPALVRIAARQSLESDLAGEQGTATNIGFRLCRER